MLRNGEIPKQKAATIDIDRLDEEREDFISAPKHKPLVMKRAEMKPK